MHLYIMIISKYVMIYNNLCDEQVDEAKRNGNDPGRVWESEVWEPKSASCC